MQAVDLARCMWCYLSCGFMSLLHLFTLSVYGVEFREMVCLLFDILVFFVKAFHWSVHLWLLLLMYCYKLLLFGPYLVVLIVVVVSCPFSCLH